LEVTPPVDGRAGFRENAGHAERLVIVVRERGEPVRHDHRIADGIGQQVELLEDHADPLCPEPVPHAGAQGRDVDPLHRHAARIGRDDAAYQRQER
jgi:hypothetical protein